MNIIKPHTFVIESYLPVEIGEGEDISKVTIEGDMPVKDVKYAWHWYCGLTPVPGTGGLSLSGKAVMPLIAMAWSPYFEDAQVFDDKDIAIQTKIDVFGKDDVSVRVVEIAHSHYHQTWKIKE